MGNKKKGKDKKNDKDMAGQPTLTSQLRALLPKGSSLTVDDLVLAAISEFSLSDEHVVNIVKTLKDEAKQIAAMDSRDKGKGKGKQTLSDKGQVKSGLTPDKGKGKQIFAEEGRGSQV